MTTTIELLPDEWLPPSLERTYRVWVDRISYTHFYVVTAYSQREAEWIAEDLASDAPFPEGWHRKEPTYRIRYISPLTFT
jgi:hypothetical protein